MSRAKSGNDFFGSRADPGFHYLQAGLRLLCPFPGHRQAVEWYSDFSRKQPSAGKPGAKTSAAVKLSSVALDMEVPLREVSDAVYALRLMGYGLEGQGYSNEGRAIADVAGQSISARGHNSAGRPYSFSLRSINFGVTAILGYMASLCFLVDEHNFSYKPPKRSTLSMSCAMFLNMRANGLFL